MKPTVAQAAWAAGFFDGEGTVTIRAMRTWSTAPSISVNQVNKDPLHALQALYGGRIHVSKREQGNQRQVHGWELSGAANVRGALESMLPYLVVKYEQAVVGLQLCERIGAPSSGVALTLGELTIRRSLWEELQTLNRRGVHGG